MQKCKTNKRNVLFTIIHKVIHNIHIWKIIEICKQNKKEKLHKNIARETIVNFLKYNCNKTDDILLLKYRKYMEF